MGDIKMPQQERIRCPFSARNSVLRHQKYQGGTLRFAPVTTPPSEFPIIEIRDILPGPGRGHKGEGGGGFPLIATYSIVEMLNNPNYEPIAQNILTRFKAILKDYIATGVIDREDLL